MSNSTNEIVATLTVANRIAEPVSQNMFEQLIPEQDVTHHCHQRCKHIFFSTFNLGPT